MSVNVLLVFLLSYIYCSVSVKINETPTTTKTYDLDIPGSSPIRIVEGETLWKRNGNTTPKPASRSEHRVFNTASLIANLNNPINREHDDNSAELSHSALRDFLNSYADKVKNKRPDHHTSDEDKEGKKNWSMLDLQENTHSYEDRKNWVSLDPVPWSLSKISKWQNKPTTTERPWGSFSLNENKPHDFDYTLDRVSSTWNKPSVENNYHYNNQPEPNENKFQVYYVDEDKPTYTKPSAVYGQTVHVHVPYQNQRHPVKSNTHYQHNQNCNHDESIGIITDGKPANFPSSNYENRRIGTELQPEIHPHMGEGEWVLLSTTKGYKAPKIKQRSLNINTQSVGAHQSVSLTVLPPLKGSKVNMTTSHGGLLQVDSSFETVEQAQKKFIKLQKLKDKPKRNKLIKKKKPLRELTSSTIATIPRSTPPDSSAVLAAVGAGMIPATMAMLMPFAVNGRKKRNVVFATSIPSRSRTQITQHRYF